MIVYLVLTVANVALGMPDIGLSYRYPVPSTSYGTPIRPADRPYVDVRSSAPTGLSTPSTQFQTPIREHTVFNTNSLSGRISSPEFTSSIGGVQSLQTSSDIDTRSNFLNQEKEVQRHLYFYTAPEEPQEVRPRLNVQAAPSRKDVKIIFIKVPSPSAPAPIQYPVQAQNEEKTVIYVLVKKPEEQTDTYVPIQTPTKPSKPEVYFIKYKTTEEAEAAISRVQSGILPAGVISVGANTVEGNRGFIDAGGQDVSNNRNNGVSLSSILSTDSGNFDDGQLVINRRVNLPAAGSSTIGNLDLPDVQSTTPGLISSTVGSRLGTSQSFSSAGPPSTTASSLDSYREAGAVSDRQGVHQVYGPPKP